MKNFTLLTVLFLYWFLFIPLLYLMGVILVPEIIGNALDGDILPSLGQSHLILFYISTGIFALWANSMPENINKFYVNLVCFLVLFLLICEFPRNIIDFIRFVILGGTYMGMIAIITRKKPQQNGELSDTPDESIHTSPQLAPIKKRKKPVLIIICCVVFLGGLIYLVPPLFTMLNSESVASEQMYLSYNAEDPAQTIKLCREELNKLATPLIDMSVGQITDWTAQLNSPEKGEELKHKILALLKEKGFQIKTTHSNTGGDSLQCIITTAGDANTSVLTVSFVNNR